MGFRSSQSVLPSHRRVEMQWEEHTRQIMEWLDKQFPDLDRHPAAIVTVMKLRYMLGPGRVTRTEHGALIRKAVAAFDRQCEPEGETA